MPCDENVAGAVRSNSLGDSKGMGRSDVAGWVIVAIGPKRYATLGINLRHKRARSVEEQRSSQDSVFEEGLDTNLGCSILARPG